MVNRARAYVAPVYLFACLVLGGSAQGIWQNMVLQIAGVAILAWAAIDRSAEPVAKPARQLLWLALGAVAVVALQMIPLPASVWSGLGPRETVAQGYAALGMPVPAAPLSLTPASSLSSLLGIIPPLALFSAMVCLQAYRPRWLAVALITGTVMGIALGALQVASFDGRQVGAWYLYQQTNAGRGVGFFANANHMATLLVITIPFLAAFAAPGKKSTVQRYSAIVAVAAGLGILVMVGLALNGSLAGYGLALPVLVASISLLLSSAKRLRLWLVGATLLLMIGAVAIVQMTPIGGDKIGAHATGSVESRQEILATTTRAIGDFMPFGSGLGSFIPVYHLYERPEAVTKTYVVHAHNDYAEVALELGLAGVAIILLFLAWWGAAAWRAWRTAEGGAYAKAAAIASAAVLVHSIVDFPLRTAAIAACFAMCLALLAQSRAAPPQEKSELRRRRHVEFK